jgi:hypothetical protein
MEVILEIDDDGRGRLEFGLPADASEEDIAYIESLVPRLESGWFELLDPRSDEVVFSCRPSLTGESLLQETASSVVKVTH